MSKVRGLFLVSLIAFSLLFGAALVKAEVPDVTILPDEKIVSVNAPVVIKVDPKTSEAPMRVTWSVYNTGNIGLGSFPIVNGKGLCYFSNTDGNATCGPSPFFNAEETELYIYVVTPTHTYNKTLYLNISPAAIPMGGVNKVDNTVYMYINVDQKDMMKYSIYKEDLSIYQSERPLDFDIADGRYEGNITLNPGVYYFTFIMNDSGTYGSALKRIEIPSGDFLGIQAGKSEYWIGEKIRITGTTNANSVIGEVRYPDGRKALDFSADVPANRTFSYEFYSKSDWPEGTYEIRTTSPLAKTATFALIEFFQLTPESVAGTVNKSEAFSGTISVKNVRANATNITLDVSGDMAMSYVTLLDSYLEPQESTSIQIAIPYVQTEIDGGIKLKTSEGLQLTIPVSIAVLEPGQQCVPAAKALEIDSDSLVWSQECLAGEEIRHIVKLRNKGTGELTDFSYDVENVYTGVSGEQSLENLDMVGNIDVPVSGLSIASGDAQEFEITATPDASGKYNGIITFSSGSEKASMFVALNCFENISAEFASLAEDLAALNPTQDISDDINYDISQAESALSLGNYEQANEYYNSAKAKLAILGTGGVAQPLDMTMLIIIIVIIIVIIVFLWFFKFRKPRVAGMETGGEELENF
jgi:hypothetical protein